jgi:hypothetical protein
MVEYTFLLTMPAHLWHKVPTMEVAMSVQETLNQMAGDDSAETKGWDDGMDFANTLKMGVLEELRELRRLNYPDAYIDAWKLSAQNIFYSLTDEGK